MDLWTVRVTTCASCSFVLTCSEKTPTDGLFCTLTTGQENSGLRHLDLTSPHNSRVDGLYRGGRGALAGQVLPADVTEEHLKLYTNRLQFYHKTRDDQVVKAKGVKIGSDF
ncbi:hypothetical protein NP493_1500g00059 [Ridgeia piscesae]|uniref:Uncharacterized protein n=1 Tax=Ridgeia piscesae TaxID=27915 RepID=A0AAD9NBW2_RIDPI|nr:hypothetical protein NP493_1500g00059 [Ridgeia piscesae]